MPSAISRRGVTIINRCSVVCLGSMLSVAAFGASLEDSAPAKYSGAAATTLLRTAMPYPAESIAALRGISKTKFSAAITMGYYANGDGGAGVYFLDSTDSATTDNGCTNIVAADGGRWKLVNVNHLSVKQCGAKLDAVTDDTTAIQNTVDALRSGGVVRIPSGTAKVSTLNLPTGVQLVGDGPYASVLQTNGATGTVVYMHPATRLADLKISSSVSRTTGFFVDIQGNGASITNLEFDSYYIAVSVGTLGKTVIVAPTVANSKFRNPSVAKGAGAIQFLNFSNAIVDKNVITGPASPGQQPAFGIRFQNGDTAFVSNSNVTLHGKALLVDTPAGFNTYALSITNSIFDSAGVVDGAGAVSSAEIVPAGGVYNTRISNSWFGLAASKSGAYLAPYGAGVIDGFTFDGCEFTQNGDSGLLVVGPAVKNWSVTGGHSGGNAEAGIRAAGGTSYFLISGHRAGNIAGRGPNRIGIKIDSETTSDYYNVSNNHLLGNTNSAMLDGATGTHKTITNNLGTSPFAPSSIAVGASPFTFTNNTGAPVSIHITGGKVSSVSVDGRPVANATNVQAVVPQGKGVLVVYSATPIMEYLGF